MSNAKNWKVSLDELENLLGELETMQEEGTPIAKSNRSSTSSTASASFVQPISKPANRPFTSDPESLILEMSHLETEVKEGHENRGNVKKVERVTPVVQKPKEIPIIFSPMVEESEPIYADLKSTPKRTISSITVQQNEHQPGIAKSSSAHSPVTQTSNYASIKATSSDSTLASSKKSTATSASVEELQRQRIDLEKRIEELNNEKKKLVLKESYEEAQNLKEVVDGLEVRLRAVVENLRERQKDFGAKDPSEASQIEKKDKQRKTLEEAYRQKRDTLNAAKIKAVNDEDYAQAEYLRQQLNALDENYQKDLGKLEGSQKAYNPSVKEGTSGNQQHFPAVPNMEESLSKPSPKSYTDPPSKSYTDPPKKSASSSASEPQPGKTMTKKAVVQYTQDSKLYDLARTGRSEEIRKAVEEDKMDVNSVDFQTGNTPLFGAVMQGFREVGGYLIEKGANVNIKNRRGQIALHIAIEKRMDEMARFLIDKGADANLKDNTGKSPLDMAFRTPIWQQELKEYAYQASLKIASEKKPEEIPEGGPSESIPVYLKNGSYHTFGIVAADTTPKVIQMMANKLNVADIVKDLELVEEVMGKERVLKETERVLEAYSKFPNTNAKFCKFLVKVKRGSPEATQMKFREAIYG